MKLSGFAGDFMEANPAESRLSLSDEEI